MSVDIASGTFSSSNCDIGTIDLDISSGKITTENLRSDNIKLKATSGKTTLGLDALASEYNVNVRIGSGDVKLKGEGIDVSCSDDASWGNGENRLLSVLPAVLLL